MNPEDPQRTTLRSQHDAPTWDQATVSPDSAPPAAAADDLPRIEGFRVIEAIGAGGMGTVWKAEQLATRREVAIKLLRLPTERGRLRFEREVELCARLDHPHIARLYTSGLAEDGQHYYALQLIDGLPLDVFVRERGLSPRETLRLMATVARAVHHAHQRGIIHRDLKPDNVLVDAAGAPFVLDFGLAKELLDDPSAAAGERELTRDGALAGTPSYMAPEQAAGRARETDTRTDVYALGVVLFELLAGELPFKGESTFEVLRQIVERPAPRLAALRPALRGDVDTIVGKAMEREPDRRYDSALALALDLEAHLDDRPIEARPLSRGERLRRWVRRNRLIALLLLVIACGGVATTGGAVWAAISFQHQAQQERELRRQAEVLTDAAERSAERERQARADERLAHYFGAMHLAGQTARQPGGVGPARRELERWRGSPLADWEWRHLMALTGQQRDDTPTIQVGQPIYSMAESRRGQLALGLGGGLVVVDLESMEAVFSVTAHRLQVVSVAFDHAGQRLISASLDGTVKLWRLDREEPLAVLRHPKGVAAAAISPDGHVIASHGVDAAVRLWSVASGEVFATLRGELDGQPPQLAFDRDSRRLAYGGVVGNDRFPIRVYDLAQRREVARLAGLRARARCIRWRPDGRQLAAAGYDRQVLVWDLTTARPVAALRGHRAEVRALAWSADGRWLASAGLDRDVFLWDPAAGRLLRPLGGHTATVNALTWSPRGLQLSSAGEDGTARSWDLGRRPGQVALTLQREGRASADGALAWRPDGGALTASQGDVASRWDSARLGRGEASAPLLAWGEDGARVARVEGALQLTRGSTTRRVPLPTVGLRRLAWRPGGTELLALGVDRLTRVTAAGETAPLALDAGGAPLALAWRPAGDAFALTYNCGLLELRAADGRRLARHQLPSGLALHAVAWHPHGAQLATADDRGALRLHGWRDGALGEPVTLPAHSLRVRALAWHPSGTRLASAGDDGRVAIWSLAHRRVALWLPHGRPLVALAWSPDGARLAALDEGGRVLLWNSR